MSDPWNKMNYPRETLERIFSKIDYPGNEKDCWEWIGYKNKDGYGQTSLFKKPHILVHRLIYECYNGPIPDKLLVRHKLCNNSSCCNPNHLELGTVQDNINDRIISKRSAVGRRNNKAILDDIEVYQILNDITQNKYNKILEIAEDYNVDRKLIENILRGDTWKHISENFNLQELREKIIDPNFYSNKLTLTDIESIRSHINLGKSQNLVASLFNVSQATISNIVNKKNNKYQQG